MFMIELEKEVPKDILRVLEDVAPYIQRLDKIILIIKEKNILDLKTFLDVLEKELNETKDVILKTDISIILGKIQGKLI